jgi:hypothetical protein
MQFKGTNKDLRAVAQELHVRSVLEGRVRRAGTSLRVTAQLIDAENDSHLWTEKYSGSLEDVFAIQEEISRKIVNAWELMRGVRARREASSHNLAGRYKTDGSYNMLTGTNRCSLLHSKWRDSSVSSADY